MMEPKLLDGKVVVVTGAGNGVGAEIAKMAAAYGASVLVNDLGGEANGEGGSDARPAQRIVDEITRAGGIAAPSFHSIASWETAEEIIQDAIKAFGRIDAVINNAGILRDVMFHKMTKEDWELVLEVNLSGYFYVSRAAAPYFKEQGKGAFVHMTSSSGLIGNMGQANYSASKLGVAGLSKSIALDMQRFNVRSNCIAPFAFTRMVGTIPANTEENRARLEVARRLTPDKIAPLACALVSDEAHDVNGQIFGARMNELILFSQSRPVRTAQTEQGWTPESILGRALPAMRPSFYPLDISSHVFTWDPY